MKAENYYYQQMTEPEQQAYRRICDGLHRHQKIIPIQIFPGMMRASEIYYQVLYDHPFFFYVKQHAVCIRQRKGECLLYPEYLYSVAQVRSMVDEMHQVVDKVVQKAMMYRNDPFKMELFLHNSVVKSVAYDFEALQKGPHDSAHSIVGPFLENKAVCEGIAKAFKMLCDLTGLPCIFVVGCADAKGEFDWNTLHAWNLVNIEGQWYHVDPTWDAFNMRRIHEGRPPERQIGFDYFNLTSEDIAVDHKPIKPVPACISQTHNYFYYTNKIARTYKESVRIIEQQFDNDRIRLRIDQKALPFLLTDPERRVLDALHEVVKKRKSTYRFIYYFNERLGTVNLCRI